MEGNRSLSRKIRENVQNCAKFMKDYTMSKSSMAGKLDRSKIMDNHWEMLIMCVKNAKIKME